MKSVCAWCQADLGRKPGPEDVITHGICNPCLEKLLAEESPRRLSDYLETLGAPVFFLDDDVTVRAANPRAAALLGKELATLPGSYGGDVVNCVHAAEPGGCGRTLHCRTCAIRNTVTDTFRSGRSHLRVLATADAATADGDRPIRFLISTEKTGDGVLLRIDEVGEPPPRTGG